MAVEEKANLGLLPQSTLPSRLQSSTSMMLQILSAACRRWGLAMAAAISHHAQACCPRAHYHDGSSLVDP